MNTSRWDIFCSVVDNYGDVGVAWRLARQLASEHAIDVRLFVDDLELLRRLASGMPSSVDTARDACTLDGVQLRRWDGGSDAPAPDRLADVVIDAFGCGIPRAYANAMARSGTAPGWIILEYLSAEPWVERHHGLASPHPSLPLQRYFYFPGFTPATGGLLRERGLLARRDAFQSDTTAQSRFWRSLGISEPRPGATVVSLFCYPHAPVTPLLDAWADGDSAVHCVVPEGVATGALDRWTHGRVPHTGESLAIGRLVLAGIPFVAQNDYDSVLWASDINFVRGEDSFVRGQWAARPLIWNTYAQAENAHALKQEAFLARYGSGFRPDAAGALRSFARAWNESGQGGEALGALWQALLRARPSLLERARSWADGLAAQTDLAAKLVKFVQNRV